MKIELNNFITRSVCYDESNNTNEDKFAVTLKENEEVNFSSVNETIYYLVGTNVILIFKYATIISSVIVLIIFMCS
jgi:hypothetical protein